MLRLTFKYHSNCPKTYSKQSPIVENMVLDTKISKIGSYLAKLLNVLEKTPFLHQKANRYQK
jgi:hypothetical protein